MDKDTFSITLFCKECENSNCRIGEIIHEQDNSGCVRQVSEELYVEYYHQVKEVWPMTFNEDKNTQQKEYINTINLLNKIYKQPTIRKNGKKFKKEEY